MSSLTALDLERLLAAVGDLLAEHGGEVEILIVGGAALLLRGETDRVATVDVDVLAVIEGDAAVFPVPFPARLRRAVEAVAASYGLAADWMNAVVAQSWAHRWPEGLPPALRADGERRTYGGLTVELAGRAALIPLKLHAVVDRARAAAFDAEGYVTDVDFSPPDAQRHLRDLVALRPTDAELRSAAAWVQEQEASPHLGAFLRAVDTHVRSARR
jgi:hypothetical protein